MFKKYLLLIGLILFINVSGAFAYGIGLQIDGDPYGGGMGPAVTFKLDKYPIVFAASVDVTADYFSMGITGDWWLFNKPIDDSIPVKWFLGYGFFGNIGMGDPFAFIAGGRLPVGLNAFFQNGFIEPFLQIAPSVGIKFAPDFHFPEWFVPVSFGVRFWFE